MKANPDKFQFIILGNTGLHTLQIGDITTKSVSFVTLLGIIWYYSPCITMQGLLTGICQFNFSPIQDARRGKCKKVSC